MRNSPPPLIRALAALLMGAVVLALLPARGAQDAKPPRRGDEPTRLGDEKSEEQEAAEAEARLEERRETFRICDGNGNGWISFREAEAALGLDRAEYANFDEEPDGRVYWWEFEKRYAQIYLRSGGVPAADPELRAEAEERGRLELPDLAALAGAGGFPTPTDILLIFDRNKLRGLDYAELDRMFLYLSVELTAIEVLSRMDRDKTGELEIAELLGLSSIIRGFLPKRFAGLTKLADEEIYPFLLASPVPRRLPEGAPPAPPLIPGPVTHFRRLDLDDNGYVNPDDLRELLVSSGLNVRPTALLAAIDLNGDGRVDEREFLAGLGAR